MPPLNNGIILVISSLTSGGAERVMSEFANHVAHLGLAVNMILLTKKERFYELHSNIQVREPDFTIDTMARLFFQWRDFWWLRNELLKSNSKTILSFGGKYNAFVLLASRGLRKQVYLSDRSRPSISYGRFLDTINPCVYRWAAGIVAQTKQAQSYIEGTTGHKNIRVIPNPIREVAGQPGQKEKKIINVGRFITSKHQDWLLSYFEALQTSEWSLHFFGEGTHLQEIKRKSASLTKSSQIHFHGIVQNIDIHYQKAALFAFTSTSEGFPNALGEAMSAGCACISFDCEAGPADLIDDGENGFLIPEGDHQQYKEKLQLLINDKSLRHRLGQNAQEKMKEFSIEKIGQKYLEFLFNQ